MGSGGQIVAGLAAPPSWVDPSLRRNQQRLFSGLDGSADQCSKRARFEEPNAHEFPAIREKKAEEFHELLFFGGSFEEGIHQSLEDARRCAAMNEWFEAIQVAERLDEPVTGFLKQAPLVIRSPREGDGEPGLERHVEARDAHSLGGELHSKGREWRTDIHG